MRLTVPLVALCFWAATSAAQSRRESLTDSALVDFAAIAAFKVVAGHVGVASQGIRHAWIIDVPAGSARWDSLARHLRVALRARDTSITDTQRLRLVIRLPRLVGDTLIGHVNVDNLFRCPTTGTSWWENTMIYEARVVHGDGSSWFPAIRELIHGTAAPCAFRE